MTRRKIWFLLLSDAAKSKKLTLVTNNFIECERIEGLNIENWRRRWEKHKVLIRKCATYDPDKIAGTREWKSWAWSLKGGSRRSQRGPWPTWGCTSPCLHPQGVPGRGPSAVKARAGKIKELAVGERSGITIPTRFNFKEGRLPGGDPKTPAKRLHHFHERVRCRWN